MASAWYSKMGKAVVLDAPPDRDDEGYVSYLEPNEVLELIGELVAALLEKGRA